MDSSPHIYRERESPPHIEVLHEPFHHPADFEPFFLTHVSDTVKEDHSVKLGKKPKEKEEVKKKERAWKLAAAVAVK